MADEATVETYYVSGTVPFRGTAPGESLEADPNDPAVQRAIERGSISTDSPEEDLKKKTRDELNAIAVDEGIETAENFANKDEVIDAIKAAREGATQGGNE